MTPTFETSRVRPSPPGPRICNTANLPAFTTKKDAKTYRETLGDHWVVLAEWECSACRCWHYWASAPGDTNGGYLAGSRTIPKRIEHLIARTKLEASE